MLLVGGVSLFLCAKRSQTVKEERRNTANSDGYEGGTVWLETVYNNETQAGLSMASCLADIFSSRRTQRKERSDGKLLFSCRTQSVCVCLCALGPEHLNVSTAVPVFRTRAPLC